ncbi:MAG TPA: glycosyltransferase [Polyangiales bacterium]
MLKALISVLLPFREAASTIDAALAGLLAHTDAALEVLAIDDGSTDGGPTRVRAWAARDGRVRLVRAHGRGLAAALQLGLVEARGALIARMDADDLSHPERLVRQRAFLLERPEVSVVGARVRAFCDEGDVGAGLLRYVAWQNGLISPHDHRRELFVESPLCHPSIMLRRDALCAVGGYQAHDGPEDYDLFLRLDQAGHRLAKLPEELLAWRHRAGRATFSDPRYSLARMRAAKAPFLAARVAASDRARRVLWGAGPTGRRLARELRAHGLSVHAFVDIDPRKIGRVAQGVPIVAQTELSVGRDFVIGAVGAEGARSLIRAVLLDRRFIEGEDCLFAA